MMKVSKFLFTFGCFVVCVVFAEGSLVFEQESQFFDPSVEDKETVALYKFTNKGEKVIEVKSVKPSCGCTVCELDQKVFKPGESGTIKAVFSHDSREGKQYKKITVKTDDEKTPEIVLSLVVDIPIAAKATPRMLVWNKTDPLMKKKILVECFLDRAIKITEITSSNPVFQVEVKPVKDSRNYLVYVTPKIEGERTPQRSTIKIVTDLPETYTVYLRLR